MSNEEEDNLIWTGGSYGVFSVQLVLGRVSSLSNEGPLPCLAWRNLVPLRVQAFMWSVLRKKTPTRMSLTRRGLLNPEDDLQCPLCNQMEEEADHLFLKYPIAGQLWRNFLNLMGILWVLEDICEGIMCSWSISRLEPRRKMAWNTIPVAILWSIWKERNTRFFRSKESEVTELFQKAKWRLCTWLLSGKDFTRTKITDFYQSWEGSMSETSKKL